MADKGMKKRWISLYVENQVGVLPRFPDFWQSLTWFVLPWCHRGSYRFE